MKKVILYAMKHQKIELNEETNIFEADITIVNTDKLIRRLPNIELDNFADEFIVKKHRKHLELIPFE